MSRRIIALGLVAAVAIGVAVQGAQVQGAQGAQAADLPTIYVEYRLDCTFQLTHDSGQPVTQVAPGTYQVVVATPEPFAAENTSCGGAVSFRLTGPGVTVFTTLDDGDGAFALFGVVFQTGASYTAQEDKNVAATRRTFVASAPAQAPLPSTASPSASSSTKKTGIPSTDPVGAGIRGELAGSVSTAGKLALTFKGKPVSALKSGRYTITVLDETSKTGFQLQRRGKAAKTLSGLRYLGRKTVTLSLGRGQWMFYTPLGKKHYFVVTA